MSLRRLACMRVPTPQCPSTGHANQKVPGLLKVTVTVPPVTGAASCFSPVWPSTNVWGQTELGIWNKP